MQRAAIVEGLGFGDEGKGATVDFLARELDAELVVRFCGGSQAGHNVELPDGCRHTFSQFGAGTLAGAATYLSQPMIIHPPAMHREAEHLRALLGADPFDRLTVHPRCLVATRYHQELNRLRELARGGARHGSCGHGIGETRHDWLQHGSDAVTAADLKSFATLEAKLELLRQRALIDAQSFIENVPIDEAWRFELFFEPVSQLARTLVELGRPLVLADEPPPAATAIFEGAQGILLDEWRGFHPYTTWSTATLEPALALAERWGAREVATLGLTRGYATRHGSGPLPTAAAELGAALSDPGNPRNRWQGTIRFGWLDLVLLRYAVEAAGGPLDGLVVNCLDQLEHRPVKICTAYRLADASTLERLPVSPLPSLAAQQRLTALLESVTPIYETIAPGEICDRLAALAPLAITARGPNWQDRTLRSLEFHRREPHLSDSVESAVEMASN